MHVNTGHPFCRATVSKKPRYVKSVKIGLILVLVFFVSFAPTMYAVSSGKPLNVFLRHSLSINNLANFFIYLVVDEAFRAKLKSIFAK